ADESFDIVRQVVPAIAVDYLDLRTINWDGGVKVIDSVGMRCGEAVDTEACSAGYDALSIDSEFDIAVWSDICCEQRQLAYSRGDEVGVVASTAELDAFLGPIDAPGDAALVLLLKHRWEHLRCDAAAQIGPHEEGFVAYTRSGSGCGAGNHVRDNVVLVRTDGSIEVLESDIIERGTVGCSIPG
ncbi:MAG: hypothetical protein R3B09_29405, partial [Nannocystaceae bacterium]